MKIHSTIHLVLLSVIVYLAAQLSSSTKNSGNVLVEHSVANFDGNKLKASSDEYKKQLQDKDKEIQLLKKSTEVANDKVKGLRKEVSQLTAEIDQLNKEALTELKNPAKRFSNLFNSSKMSRKESLIKFYSPLFDKLGLSEEEEKEFLELVQGNGASFIMINGVPFAGNNKTSDELKNFLGEDLPVYEQYKKTAMERSQINSMNNNLADEDKLSEEDQEVLVGLLNEKKQARRDGTKVSNDEILERANFLNSQQKAAFEKQLKSPITFIKSSSISIR